MSDGITEAFAGTYFSDRSKLKKIDIMDRKEIYRILDNERKYQDTIRKRVECETRDDNEKSVAEFILYMEYILNEAKNRVYHLDTKGALGFIRKATALGIATGEAFGFPERQ